MYTHAGNLLLQSVSWLLKAVEILEKGRLFLGALESLGGDSGARGKESGLAGKFRQKHTVHIVVLQFTEVTVCARVSSIGACEYTCE